jgi:hypothetical protein
MGERLLGVAKRQTENVLTITGHRECELFLQVQDPPLRI